MEKQQKKWLVPSTTFAAAYLALVVAATPFIGLVNESVAGADTPPSGFYLDLGASESVGLQPTLADPRGQRTSQGYSNDVVAFEAARGVTLQLTELGCPGETTTTMMSGGDRCYDYRDNQFSEAMAFLRSHQQSSGIVTIDLGFNDVHRCFRNEVVDQTCVAAKMDALRQELPTLLAGLRKSAGPDVTFVGLGHYDPFLADALKGPAGKQFAQATATAIDSLNAALHDMYTDAGIAMASVGTAFESRNVTRVHMVGKGMVPDNVASACDFTWMCVPAPLGPNLHPNEAGYDLIASAIESVLRPPW